MPLNDENEVKLEGTILHMSEVQEVDSKKVVNFTVDNEREGKLGKQNIAFPIVMWNANVDRYASVLEVGSFVRIKGHLQSFSVLNAENIPILACKVCVDRLEIAE